MLLVAGATQVGLDGQPGLPGERFVFSHKWWHNFYKKIRENRTRIFSVGGRRNHEKHERREKILWGIFGRVVWGDFLGGFRVFLRGCRNCVGLVLAYVVKLSGCAPIGSPKSRRILSVATHIALCPDLEGPVFV